MYKYLIALILITLIILVYILYKNNLIIENIKNTNSTSKIFTCPPKLPYYNETDSNNIFFKCCKSKKCEDNSGNIYNKQQLYPKNDYTKAESNPLTVGKYDNYDISECPSGKAYDKTINNNYYSGFGCIGTDISNNISDISYNDSYVYSNCKNKPLPIGCECTFPLDCASWYCDNGICKKNIIYEPSETYNSPTTTTTTTTTTLTKTYKITTYNNTSTYNYTKL